MRTQSHPLDLLILYLATRYRVRLPRQGSVDIGIGRIAPGALDRLIGAQHTGIVSACNPASRLLSIRKNRRRTRELITRLEEASVQWLPAIGTLDGWREPSVCVLDSSLRALDDLARSFGQNAIVVGSRGHSMRLRVYRTDWLPMRSSIDANVRRHIDWVDDTCVSLH